MATYPEGMRRGKSSLIDQNVFRPSSPAQALAARGGSASKAKLHLLSGMRYGSTRALSHNAVLYRYLCQSPKDRKVICMS